MSDVNVRLECLKLAAGTTREVGEMVARAKTFEDYVTGPEAPASPQGSGAKPKAKAQGTPTA